MISYVESFLLLNFFKTFLGLGHLCYRPFVPALGKWRQEDEEHKVILGYIANLSQKIGRMGCLMSNLRASAGLQFRAELLTVLSHSLISTHRLSQKFHISSKKDTSL